MIRVVIKDWRPGFRKVPHTKLIEEYTGLPSSLAKERNDRILRGEMVVVELPTPAAAEEFTARSRELGAVTEVEHQASRAR